MLVVVARAVVVVVFVVVVVVVFVVVVVVVFLVVVFVVVWGLAVVVFWLFLLDPCPCLATRSEEEDPPCSLLCNMPGTSLCTWMRPKYKRHPGSPDSSYP